MVHHTVLGRSSAVSSALSRAWPISASWTLDRPVHNWARLGRIKAGLAGESGRREILERNLAELKQHVAALQSRIKEIEQRLGR